MVVYPFQGHINPMLHLASFFHSKGFSITIIHQHFNSSNPSNHPEFTFVSIPTDTKLDSMVSAGELHNIALILNKNSAIPLQNIIEDMCLKNPNEKLSGIIYDTIMYCAQSVADHFNVPGISLRTSAAAATLAYSIFPSTDGTGYITFQDMISENGSQDSMKELIGSLSVNLTPTALELRVALTREMQRASAVIANTMDFLEQEAIATIKEIMTLPIFPVGPVHKLTPPKISSSLLQEDSTCISWLDKQEPKSVVYVSCGSLGTMDEQEFVDSAWEMASSEQPFLWVVRPGSINGSEWIEPLPESFHEKVGGKCCIVKWAPQKEVLAHSAVGAFWSHCGWNSTLESISEGVPLLCKPLVGDQPLNSRYICKVWKIGLELEKGKIAEGIKKLMEAEEGVEIRKRAMEFKEKTEACLGESGSTMTSLNTIIEHILL